MLTSKGEGEKRQANFPPRRCVQSKTIHHHHHNQIIAIFVFHLSVPSSSLRFFSPLSLRSSSTRPSFSSPFRSSFSLPIRCRGYRLLILPSPRFGASPAGSVARGLVPRRRLFPPRPLPCGRQGESGGTLAPFQGSIVVENCQCCRY